jgi:hypothetical protein
MLVIYVIHRVIMRPLLIFLLLIPGTLQQPKPNTVPAKTAISKGNDEKKTSNEKTVAPDGALSNCAAVEKPPTKPEQAQSYDAGHDTLYRAYLWFTIIGVPLAFVGICVLYRQGRVIKNAERAWLIATPIDWSPPLRSDGPHQLRGENVFRVKVANIGKTPARVIRSSVRYVLIDSLEALPKEPDYGVLDPEQDLIVAPHEIEEPESSLVSRAVLERPNGVLTAEEHTAIVEREKVLYAFGFVRYLDIHGTKRETRFGYCYVHRKANEALGSAFAQAGSLAYRKTT